MPSTRLEFDALDQLEQSFSGRVIRPADGVELEDRHLRLEDVDSLVRTLIEKSEGRLEALRQATAEIEHRIRTRVDATREQVDRALETARTMIAEQLAQAGREAAALRESARQTGHQEGERAGFEKGYSEGLEKGLREGREQGRQAIEAELRERLERAVAADIAGTAALVGTLVGDLDHKLGDLVRSARADLMGVALGIARKILQREVREQPEIVAETVARAIDRIADRHRFTVEVHPEDRAVVREYLNGLEEKFQGSAHLKIVENADLERGGCRVTDGASEIDLTIETQLEILERRFSELREGTA